MRFIHNNRIQKKGVGSFCLGTMACNAGNCHRSFAEVPVKVGVADVAEGIQSAGVLLGYSPHFHPALNRLCVAVDHLENT